MALPLLSVIIPTFNEELHLAATLASVLTEGAVEVLVVDGGSTDRTCDIAVGMGARVLHSPSGRALQMNTGAEYALAENVLFLHGDTIVPSGYLQIIGSCLAQPETALGAFRLHLSGSKKGLGLISWGANVRARWLGLVYGDQGLFMNRGLFMTLGGYPQIAICEDVMLVRKMRKKGRVTLVAAEVKSSGRRWTRYGLWFPTLINQIVILGFFLGLPAHLLAKVYGVSKEI